MGTNCAPPLGNSHVVDTSTLATAKYEADFSLATTPVHLWSFQDDAFAIWTGSYNACLWWLACFNQIYARMSITYTISQMEADFMDLHIFKGDRFQETGLLDYEVYQKPINRYLYIPFHSFHTTASKQSFISTELDRYVTHSSNARHNLRVKRLFYKRLRARGYPLKFLSPLFKKHSYMKRATLFKTRSDTTSFTVRQQPLIFKTVNNKRNDTLGLRNFLSEIQHSASLIPTLKKCSKQRPILCLRRPNNLSNVLRPM